MRTNQLLISAAAMTAAFFVNNAHAQSVNWSLNPLEQKVFVENRGQFDGLNGKPGSQVYYGVDNMGTEIYFTKNSLTYRFERFETEREEVKNKKALEGLNAPGEEEAGMYKVRTCLADIAWLHSDPNVKVKVEEKVAEYFNYATAPGKSINFVPGFKKLVYNNLYPGIDVEYTFHEKEGMKYILIVHPGADLSKVKIRYGSDPSQVSLDSKGNIRLRTEMGEIMDHAPVSFFEDGEAVRSAFELDGNTAGFTIDLTPDQRSKIKNQKLIIDPWTVNPAFTTDIKVYDIEKDGAGNVYMFGGLGPYKLKKYTAGGTAIWTTNSTNNGQRYGDLAVTGSGVSYISAGHNGGGAVPVLSKVNTTGAIVWSNTLTFTREYWCIAANCSGTQIVVGDSFPGGWISNIDTTNGNRLNTTSLTTGSLDFRSMCVGPNGNYYLLTTTSGPARVVGVTPAFATTFSVVSGHTSPYNGTTLYANGPSPIIAGFNGIDASLKYVYHTDGAQIWKRDITNGNQISNIPVPGGLKDANCGIAVDGCGNVYVGSQSTVLKYDSNLTLITTTNTGAVVYDVTIGSAGEVLVCGNGFASSLNFNACPTTAASMTVNATGTNSTCSSTNGSATASATGGSGAYTYSWSNGATTQTITGLSSGTYTVVISDGTGCNQNLDTITITGGGLNLATQANNILCNGQLTGAASVTTSGGQGSYTYSWSNGATSQSITGLSMGGYTVTVTDSAGCSTTQAFNITQPALLAVSDSSNNILCNGNNTGSSFLVTSGGTGSYTYLWSNGATTPSITGVSAGTYSVVVSDANGCTSTRQVTISQPGQLTLTATGNSVNCTDDTLASATAFANGGTTPFTYSWNTGATTSSITGLTAGSYTVMVTDANGCTSLQVVNVVVNTKPKASISATPTSGQVPLNVVFTNGSTGGSTYSWDFGDGNSSTSQNTSNTYVNGGTYTVMMIVTASNGCKDTAYITIIADGFSTLIVPNVFSPNGDGTNDVFVIESIGLKDLTLEIYDRWGLLMTTITSITGGWDGKAKSGNDAPEGTYYYILKAHGIDNKEYDMKGYLMLLRD